jgi:hypothetical protein
MRDSIAVRELHDVALRDRQRARHVAALRDRDGGRLGAGTRNERE